MAQQKLNLKCTKESVQGLKDLTNNVLESFHHLDGNDAIDCTNLAERLSDEHKYACFVLKNPWQGTSDFGFYGLDYVYQKWKCGQDEYWIYVIKGEESGMKKKIT